MFSSKVILSRVFRNLSRRNLRHHVGFFRRSFFGAVLRNNEYRRSIIGRTAFGAGGMLFGLSLWQKVAEDPDNVLKKKIQDIVARADAMYDNQMLDGLYDYLKEECSKSTTGENAELLWRLARATYEKAKKAKDVEERRRLTYEAFDRVKRALELDQKSFATHKWYAILLEKKSGYEGTKAKIKESYNIKDHLLKALDLNPRDATTWHILGVWYFTIAGLKWYERTAASTFFASPPTATYQEALDCFLKAESISPNFYSQNLLYLGKVYKEVGDANSAKRYLNMTLNYVVVSSDDYTAHQEAEKLLKEIK